MWSCSLELKVCSGMSVCAKSLQSCLTLCDPMDCSLPGSFVHGILQTRILECVAMPSSGGSSLSRDQTHTFCGSCIAGRYIYIYIYRYIYIYIYLQLSHWGSLCFGIQLTKHAITYLWVLGKRKNNVLHSYQGRMLNLIVKIWKAFQKRCKVKAIEWVGVTQEKPEDSASDRERAWLSQEKKVIPHEWIRECVCFVGGGGVGRQGGKQ